MTQEDAPESVPEDRPEPMPRLLVGAAPDCYADTFNVSASAYTISLHFGVQVTEQIVKPQAVIHMSPQHAKMMAILFTRLLKGYEQQVGEIILSDQLLQAKEVDLDRDWNAI